MIPGLGKFLGGGNGNPLQFACLGNPMDRGAWLNSSNPLALLSSSKSPRFSVRKSSWLSFLGDHCRDIQSVDKQMCTRIPVAVSLQRSILYPLLCAGFVFYLIMYLGDLSRSVLGEHSPHIPLSEYHNLSNQCPKTRCSWFQCFCCSKQCCD